MHWTPRSILPCAVDYLRPWWPTLFVIFIFSCPSVCRLSKLWALGLLSLWSKRLPVHVQLLNHNSSLLEWSVGPARGICVGWSLVILFEDETKPLCLPVPMVVLLVSISWQLKKNKNKHSGNIGLGQGSVKKCLKVFSPPFGFDFLLRPCFG